MLLPMTHRSDIGAAVIGSGFIGTVHVEALRRIGVNVVGLLDAKAERGRKALMARRLSLDPPRVPGISLSCAEFARATAAALAEFAAFNHAETIELGLFESADGRLERSLRAAVSRL